MNALKLTEVELISLFHFKSVAAYPSCFERLCKQIMIAFYTILNFHFKLQILRQFELMKTNSSVRSCIFSSIIFLHFLKLIQSELLSIFHFKTVIKECCVNECLVMFITLLCTLNFFSLLKSYQTKFKG